MESDELSIVLGEYCDTQFAQTADLAWARADYRRIDYVLGRFLAE
jgi:hypothetical protein